MDTMRVAAIMKKAREIDTQGFGGCAADDAAFGIFLLTNTVVASDPVHASNGKIISMRDVNDALKAIDTIKGIMTGTGC